MKYLPTILMLLIFIVIAILFILAGKEVKEQEHAVELCWDKGGILVQSISHGTVCVDIKAIK